MRRASDSLRLVRSALDSMVILCHVAALSVQRQGRAGGAALGPIQKLVAGPAAGALMFALLALLLFGLDGREPSAEAAPPSPSNQVIGIDADPDDDNTGGDDYVFQLNNDSLTGDGAFSEDPVNGVDDDGDGSTDEDPTEGPVVLGTIQPCISVPNVALTTFRVDVFFNTLKDTDALDAAQYRLHWNDPNDLDLDTLTTDDGPFDQSGKNGNFLIQEGPGSTGSDLGGTAADATSPNAVALVDLTVGAEESGKGGVIARHTLRVESGATSGLYNLTLDTIILSTDPLAGPGPITVEEVWDGNYASPFGVIALGVTCAGGFVHGDVDCSGPVTAVDALKILRHVASLPVFQNEPCDDIGTGGPPVQGNVDCSGLPNPVSAVDALKILRHVASLPVFQNEPCDDIGT